MGKVTCAANPDEFGYHWLRDRETAANERKFTANIDSRMKRIDPTETQYHIKKYFSFCVWWMKIDSNNLLMLKTVKKKKKKKR